MTQTEDRDSRTEEPTEKKLSDAIEKGNVPFAREAVTFGSLAAIVIACSLLASWSAKDMTLALQSVLASAGSWRFEDREGAAILTSSLVVAISAAILPVMAMIAGGSIVAALFQNPPSANGERITPKLSRISPSAGWKRLFGASGFFEFGKSVLKLLMVSVLAAVTLRGQVPEYLSQLHSEPGRMPEVIRDLVMEFLIAFAMIALLLTLADLTWSRVKWRRELRMTRHEIKEEMKQAEGDPHQKARIRSIGRQRSSRQMLKKLPQATMVVTNPTHFAVALRYASGDAGAPVVVAKGVDFMALRIREIAAKSEIPIIENKPLARALYDKVDIDAQIPAEFYRAIAEIIHFLHGRKRIPVRPPSG
jgi:flagellar biosynthesis protein FlhB